MNNIKLINKTTNACIELLKEKGYIAPIELLLKIDVVDKKQYLDWKNGKVPYLEKICSSNLSKMNLILQTIEKFAKDMKLKPSFTCYKRNGSKIKLQFSKTNSNYFENKYATSYVGMQYKKPTNNA